MVRFAGCVLLVAVATLSSSARAATAEAPAGASVRPSPQGHQDKPRGDRPQDGRPRDRWKWWLYDRAELGITDRQSAEIDRIFEETIPHQRAKRQELERLEDVLATMTRESKADVAVVAQQVDRVETLRAEMNKARTVMLYRIHLLLNPDQRVKLKALMERRDADRRKNEEPPKRH